LSADLQQRHSEAAISQLLSTGPAENDEIGFALAFLDIACENNSESATAWATLLANALLQQPVFLHK
jgi:hypothetical protein